MELNIFSKDFNAYIRRSFRDYKRTLLAFLICAVVAALFYGFSLYRGYVEARAYNSFTSCMKYFDASIESGNEQFSIDSITFSSAQEKWKKVIEVFMKGYEENSNSSLAPFFLIFAADAHMRENNFSQSKELLEKAVPLIKSNEVKTLYTLKLALMKIDGSDVQADHVAGFDMLKKIAEDSKNPLNDQALYILGEHFWFKRDFSLAKNYWNQLVLAYGQGTKDPSIYASLAAEKLKLIASK